MTLAQLRKRIDRVDRKMVALLNERANAALEVGKLKRQQGLPILVRGREQFVYANLARLNTGPLDNEQLNRIYLRIMREMKHLQRAMSAAGASASREPGSSRGSRKVSANTAARSKAPAAKTVARKAEK